MPTLLVAAEPNTTDTMTTDTVTTGDDSWIRDTTAGSAEPTTARARRHPLVVVVGLVMVSTLLLVALAVVALTDQGDDEATEDTADGATRPVVPPGPLDVPGPGSRQRDRRRADPADDGRGGPHGGCSCWWSRC